MSAPSSSRNSTQLMWPAQGSHTANGMSLVLGTVSVRCAALGLYFTRLKGLRGSQNKPVQSASAVPYRTKGDGRTIACSKQEWRVSAVI